MKLNTLITKIIDSFYLPTLSKMVPLQTFRYGVCGGLNMVIDLILYFVVYHYLLSDSNLDLGFVVISPHIAAMLIVFPITFFNGFYLNKYVTFKGSQLSTPTQLLRYLLSVLGSIVLNYICLKLFVEVLNFYPTPSKALTTTISIVYSYMMQKHFSFKETK